MPDTTVDTEKLRAEVAKLTPEQMQERLLKIRTRQKVQQAKHGGQNTSAYQKRQREMFKLMKEEAIKNGTWDGIEQQAKAAAEAKVKAAGATA